MCCMACAKFNMATCQQSNHLWLEGAHRLQRVKEFVVFNFGINNFLNRMLQKYICTLKL